MDMAQRKHTIIVLLAILLVGALTGCQSKKEQDTGENQSIITQEAENDDMGYQSITMQEAKQEFENTEGYIILDVRRADEYSTGHIPGAINIANEDIGEEEITKLPNKEQVIYVYCRSGRRSKTAAGKLAKLGYTNVIECGGILDWSGEVEK